MLPTAKEKFEELFHEQISEQPNRYVYQIYVLCVDIWEEQTQTRCPFKNLPSFRTYLYRKQQKNKK